MLSLNEILLLTIIYCLAYGFGVFLSKLWWWLRIVIFIILFRGIAFQFHDFETVNLAVFLVVIVPMCILALPSIKQLLAPRLRFSLNPFRWIREKADTRRFKNWQEREQRRGQAQTHNEDSEYIERIARMQAEQQRQFEREKAEWEAKKRQAPQKSTTAVKKDPYEVLGVSRGAGIEVIINPAIKYISYAA